MLASLWVCIAAPALCAGGVIVHPCACDDCCGCEHEAACGDDPCSIVATRNESSTQLLPQLGLVRALPAHSMSFEAPILCLADEPSALVLMALPYPPSDVPLQI